MAVVPFSHQRHKCHSFRNGGSRDDSNFTKIIGRMIFPRREISFVEFQLEIRTMADVSTYFAILQECCRTVFASKELAGTHLEKQT